MICKKCIVSRCFIAGQGFTPWTCKICGTTFIHHNTNAPKVCEDCSKEHNVCELCGRKINE